LPLIETGMAHKPKAGMFAFDDNWRVSPRGQRYAILQRACPDSEARLAPRRFAREMSALIGSTPVKDDTGMPFKFIERGE
jgi:hypothetical protein